jgi:hypothetical protein
MAKSLQFGHLGLDPVIITPDEAYALRDARKRWSKLDDADRPTVVLIKPMTFARRYGDHLGSVPKAIKGALKPLLVDGQLVALCRSKPAAGSLEHREQSETVIPIQPYLARLAQTQATFNLGRHTYSGGPGSCWSCEYRIERLNPEGSLWDILATDEETGEFQSMGNHSLEAAQDYFDGVGFSISQEEWAAMGATFPAGDDEPE